VRLRDALEREGVKFTIHLYHIPLLFINVNTSRSIFTIHHHFTHHIHSLSLHYLDRL
jgi:hypothetical protein